MNDCQPDGALRGAVRIADRIHSLVDRAIGALEGLLQLLPGLGQGHAAARSHEQRLAELRLQRRQLPADTRLGLIEILRRLGQRLEFGNTKKNAEKTVRRIHGSGWLPWMGQLSHLSTRYSSRVRLQCADTRPSHGAWPSPGIVYSNVRASKALR